jgi:AsmA protein
MLAATAAAPFLVSDEQVRDALTREIETLTGVAPIVRGQASVSLFPSPQIRFGDVSFGDPVDAPLHVDEITGHLRLWPFLIGQIEISQVTLARPRLELPVERAHNARDQAADQLVAAVARAFRSHRSYSLSMVADLRVEGGHLILRDASGLVAQEATGIDMSFALPSSGRRLAASGHYLWRGQTVETVVSVADMGTLLSGEASGVKLRLQSPKGKLAFDGQVSTAGGNRVDGTLVVDAPSLRAAVGWLGQSLPFTSGFGPLSLKSKVQAGPNSVTLSNVYVDLDGNVGEGTLTMALDRERPLVRGTLAAETFSLNPWLSDVRLFTEGSRDWSGRHLDMASLNSLDFDVRLSAARVLVGAVRLERTAAAATLRDGKLAITLGEAQVFGGAVKGMVGLGVGPDGAEARARMQFVDVQVDRTLTELIGFRQITGKGTVGVSLDASGASVQALMRTLTGQVRVQAADGSLTGVNIEQALRRLDRRPLAGLGDFRTGKTPFERLTASFNVANGLATGEEIRLVGPSVRVAIAGNAFVPARNLDLRGTASLVNPASTNGFDLPFMVHGSWDDPSITPDAESLIRRSGAAGPLLDAARERAARDAVRSAIDQITRPATP